MIRHNKDRIERPMQRHLPSKSGGCVTLINSESTYVQAGFVCDMIEWLINENIYSPDDIAVLYRSEHCARLFLSTAATRRIRVRIGSGQHGREDKIRDAYKRAHEGVASRADIFLIMNNPPRGLSRESLCEYSGDYIADMRKYYSGNEQKLAAVDDLQNAIVCFDPNEAGISQSTKNEMINAITAHASKGLEFSCVFIIGLQEGLFPHHLNMSENAEEERRLMYVAMTRAKERLYLCTVSTEHGKRPSRFAKEACSKKLYIDDILRLTRR